MGTGENSDLPCVHGLTLPFRLITYLYLAYFVYLELQVNFLYFYYF